MGGNVYQEKRLELHNQDVALLYIKFIINNSRQLFMLKNKNCIFITKYLDFKINYQSLRGHFFHNKVTFPASVTNFYSKQNLS